MFYCWDAFSQSLLKKYSIVLYCYRFFAVPVNKVLSDLMAYSVSCRMVQVADRVFRRLATRCQYDTVRSQLLSVAGRRPADSWWRWSGWTSRIRLQQNLADDGLYSLLVCWYFHCRLMAVSAFEKWSGHVEPKGSRVGCLGISPRKNWIHPFQEAIL